jgi:hypothetical protein
MAKTVHEKKEHEEKVASIVNQLADEYAAWYGRPGFGRYMALGEYILEQTESGEPHDPWLIDARESFIKSKKAQG